MPPTKNEIELHERLARMETHLEQLLVTLDKQEERRVKCDEDQTDKIDQILSNDKDKLQRLATVEERVSNIKTTLWLFLLPISGALAKWFV